MSTYERDIAIFEAARNDAVDQYFNARKRLERTDEIERFVEQGFRLGWDSRQPEIDALRARVAELEFGAKSVLQMLLTENNKANALFRAEDELRVLLVSPAPFPYSPPAPMVPEGWRKLLDMIVPRIDPTGLDEVDHCCEYTLYQDRERIHAEFAAMLAAAPEVN